MHDRPVARSEGVVTERVGEDLVIYDEHSKSAHSLSAAVAAVWELCDGELSSAAIADRSGLEPELVVRAIQELDACGLLDNGPAIDRRFLSRRQAAKRLAQV